MPGLSGEPGFCPVPFLLYLRGVYSLDMETPNIQEQSPTSNRERERSEAGKVIADRIVALINERGVSVLDATKSVYEEVKGKDYRQEEAAAKLLEYYEIVHEAELRRGELSRSYPAVKNINGDASNDDKYLVAA